MDCYNCIWHENITDNCSFYDNNTDELLRPCDMDDIEMSQDPCEDCPADGCSNCLWGKDIGR